MVLTARISTAQKRRATWSIEKLEDSIVALEVFMERLQAGHLIDSVQ